MDHATLCNGFNMTQNDGGEYTMEWYILRRWKGPVYEKDDPYGDNQTNEDLTAVKHVQEIQIIESKDMKRSRKLYSNTAEYRHPFTMHCAVHSLPPHIITKAQMHTAILVQRNQTMMW